MIMTLYHIGRKGLSTIDALEEIIDKLVKRNITNKFLFDKLLVLF